MLSGECRRSVDHAHRDRIYLIHSSSTFNSRYTVWPSLSKNHVAGNSQECTSGLRRYVNIFFSLSKVPTIELLSKLHKTGCKLFWRKKKVTRQTGLFPRHILCKMQKQKNSQGSCSRKPWAQPVMDSTATSGPSAPVVHCRF